MKKKRSNTKVEIVLYANPELRILKEMIILMKYQKIEEDPNEKISIN